LFAEGVFWKSAGGGSSSIRRIAHTGGDVTVVASGSEEYWGLHVDSQWAYTFVRPTIQPGGLLRAPHNGGGSQLFSSLTESPAYVGPLFGDVTHIYYGTGMTSPFGPLRKVDKQSGNPSELLSSALPSAVAVNGTYAYATFMHSVNEVRRIDLAMGSSKVIATQQPSPRAVAVDVSATYWAYKKDTAGIVRQVEGGGSIEDLVDELADPRGVALDDEAIHWTDRENGSVSRVALPAVD